MKGLESVSYGNNDHQDTLLAVPETPSLLPPSLSFLSYLLIHMSNIKIYIMSCVCLAGRCLSVLLGKRTFSTDSYTCCNTEKEVTDQTFYLIQSQCTDTGSTSLSTDPVMPGAQQVSQFVSHWYDSSEN